MMGFSSTQLRALKRNLRSTDIRTRASNGRELSYIEGWHAIAEANRIFGFDGWDRETIESRCVIARENRGAFFAVYVAKVRITVRASGKTVIRDGHGSGEAREGSAGEVHDLALKAAETDATKRALATFGRPFGLGLYLGCTPTLARSNANGRKGTKLLNAACSDDGLEPPQTSRAMTVNGPTRSGWDVQRQQPSASSTRLAVDSTEPNSNQPTSALTPAAPRMNGSDAAIEPSSLEGRNSTMAEQIASEAVGNLASHEHGSACEHGRSPDQHEILLDSSFGAARKTDIQLLCRPQRIRDKDHLRFVASQPCLICGRMPSDAHHLRFMQPRALSRKVSDEFSVPLCRGHHRDVHRASNEAAHWERLRVDVIALATSLWQESRSMREAAPEPVSIQSLKADQTPPS